MYKKASVASVVISLISVLISMASAAGQLVGKKAEVSGMYEQIGIAVVAGIIYLYHQIQKWRLKKKEEKQKALQASKSGIEFTHYIDLQVKHAINAMSKEFKFMRAFVINFHNGDYADSGLSLIKLTIKHEVTEYRTVKKVMEHYQGKPIPEIFYSMIRRVVKEGHYFLNDRELLSPESEFYQWLKIYDVGSLLAVEIRDTKTGKIVAILCMQWRIKDGIDTSAIPQIKEEKKSIEEIYDTL